MANSAKQKVKKPTAEGGEFLPDSDWIGATVTEEKPTAASRAIFFLLCASPVFFTLAYGAVDAWALGLLAAGASLIGLLWLLDAWQSGELRCNSSKLQFPIFGLIVIGAIQLLPLRDVSTANSLLNSPANSALTLDAQATRFFLIQLVSLLVYLAAALAFVNNQKRLRALTLTIIVFGAALAAFAIMQSLVSPTAIYGIREPSGAYPFGTFVNRHHFGGLMEMTVGLTLGLLYAGAIDKEIRPLQIFAVVVMGAALLMTTSRGAFLSLLGVLAFLTIAAFFLPHKTDDGEKPRSSNKLALFGGGAALLLLLFGVVLFLGGGGELARSIGLSGVAQDDVSNGRLHFWTVALQIFRDNWFFGVGLDAFANAFTPYDTWNGTYRVERAHNDYLQILAEAGIVGFLCVAAFIVILFRRGYKILNSTRDRFRRGVCLGSLAGITGVLIHSFFDFPLRTTSNALVFLTLAALATVAVNYPKLHRTRRSTSH